MDEVETAKAVYFASLTKLHAIITGVDQKNFTPPQNNVSCWLKERAYLLRPPISFPDNKEVEMRHILTDGIAWVDRSKIPAKKQIQKTGVSSDFEDTNGIISPSIGSPALTDQRMLAMNWFKIFYTTPTMVAAGYSDDGYGDWCNSSALNCLTEAAFSINDKPLRDDTQPSVATFSKATLMTIWNKNHNVLDEDHNELPSDHKGLVEAVCKIINYEIEGNGIGIKYRPIAWLMKGILCKENWNYLNSGDLDKFAQAHGISKDAKWDEQIRGILESQITLLAELRSKNYKRVCREYDTIYALLVDNLKLVGRPLRLNGDDRKYGTKYFEPPIMRPLSPIRLNIELGSGVDTKMMNAPHQPMRVEFEKTMTSLMGPVPVTQMDLDIVKGTQARLN
jgi:hypothetical protein